MIYLLERKNKIEKMKNPAILWYPSDFISATIFWNNEQCGAYIRLLNYQFTLGHLTQEQLNQVTNDETVLSKFIKDKNGLFYNKRMELEIEKRQKYSQSRSKNKLGKTKSYKEDINNISKTYDFHMGNENEDVNINNINYINNIDIFSYIEQEFGRILSSSEIDLIKTWEDNELTRYAIKEAVIARANSLKYVQSILNSYKAKGITSVLDAEKDKEKFEKKKLEPKKSYKEQKFDEQMKMIDEHFRKKENQNE